MTVVIGILALIGLAVVGAIGWAFAHGVRDGLAQWREVPPDGSDSNGTAEGTARPTWPAHAPSRRPPRPRPRRCTQQRPARSDERQP